LEIRELLSSVKPILIAHQTSLLNTDIYDVISGSSEAASSKGYYIGHQNTTLERYITLLRHYRYTYGNHL